MAGPSELNEQIISCRLCPRLIAWREQVAREKKRAFQDWTYWGRPVANFGDPQAERLIVGLAPAAHGANRTGRMFTGDRSGEWLYRALFEAGAANQPHAESAGDGLELSGVYISAVIHCAPPGNKPLPSEIQNCSGYLRGVLGLRRYKSILCLGSIAWERVLRTLGESKRPRFSHGVIHRVGEGPTVYASFHPSQQNTFTGKLTKEMLDSVIRAFLSG